MFAIFMFTLVASAFSSSLACAQLDKFNTCSTNAGNQMTACSSAVTSVPDITYWQCVCSSQTALTNCYTLCPDDPNMQLQYASQTSSVSGTCQYVAQQQALGNTTSLPIGSTVNVTVGSNGTKVAIPVPKKVLPPLPQSNNTNGDANINYDNGAVAMGLASSLTLMAILISIALF